MEPTPQPAEERGPGAAAGTRALRRSSWLWLAAALVLLAFPIRFWTKPVGREMLNRPSTLLDRVNPDAAAMWTFLLEAAPHVRKGCMFTVRARDSEQEMELFMLAHGTVRHATAVPSSYYGHSTPEVGARAEYVLWYGWEGKAGSDLVAIATLGDGVVLQRRDAGPAWKP